MDYISDILPPYTHTHTYTLRNHFFSFTETATDYSFIVDKELLKSKYL